MIMRDKLINEIYKSIESKYRLEFSIQSSNNSFEEINSNLEEYEIKTNNNLDMHITY